MKEEVKAHLQKRGLEVKDCGCYSTESCDYPVFGHAAAQAVADGECEKGIVICTTGIRHLYLCQQGKKAFAVHCAAILCQQK